MMKFRRLAALAFAITAGYVIAARLGFLFAFLAEQVTTVWAPSGIALAALLLCGRQMWPAVWVGAFIANAATSAPLWTAVVIATGNTLEAVVAAWLLQRDSAFDPRLRRLGDAARLTVYGAGLATTVSATIGVATLCLAALQPWDRFAGLWAAWWIGDALGVLVVAPAILATIASARALAPRDWFSILALVLGTVAITAVVFGHLLGATFGEGVLHYLVFPLAVAVAVRFAQPATALVIFAISAVAIWNTVGGAGPFASTDVHRGLILLQAFIAVLAATGVVLAAAMAERQMGQRRRGAASGIGDVLAEASNLEQAAPAILRQVCDNLDWQFGALWLADPLEQTLRCTAVWTVAGGRAASFERTTMQLRFAPGVGLPGRVWASGRAIWIENVVEDTNFPRAAMAREAGFHGAFGFPIKLGNEVGGVVEFFTQEVALPDEDLLATMSTVGNQLGQFVARKRVEGEIIQEQRRTRAILDTALDAVIAMDHHGVITEFNPAAERAFGYSKEEALGCDLADLIIPPSLREHHRSGLARHLVSGGGAFLNRRVETRGYHADGHEFPIEVAIIRVSDESPPRFTGFVRDLTDRKQAEAAVHSSEQRFRTLAASTSALTLYEQDRDLRYSWVFPQHPEFPDYNLGKTDDELLPPGEGRPLTILKQRVLDTGVGGREEITVTLPTESRSYDLMVQPRVDGNGAIVGVSGVAVDITERKRTEQLLRDSEARLRESNRHKDEFLAMLAHELRNPLAPIRTGLEAVRLSGDRPDAVATIRPMLERQVGFMVRLIDDLLDVSRISSGKIHVHRRPTDLADIVKNAVEANRAAMAAGGVHFDIQLPDEPVVLDVDPIRFVQVLSNLLNNAAKFTDHGGRIGVRGSIVRSEDTRELVLSVTDNGIGIPEEMLPRVFDLFTQAEPASNRGQGGLGIGLALAQRIVELHGGRIDAHSAGPGTGSEFTVRLPILTGDFEDQTEPASPGARRITARRVLIIDDNEDSAEAMAMLIRAMGGEAVTAGDGLEGIQRAAEFAPDAIFLDIGMPMLDGYETCLRLRQEPGGKGVLIVALTGWGQESDKQQAADAGFDAHLTKPADPAAIERLLTNIPPRAEDTRRP